MTDEEKSKIENTIDTLCEVLNFNKPIDILKCSQVITDLYSNLEKENAELKAQIYKMKNAMNCTHSGTDYCMSNGECVCDCWELKEGEK